MVNHVLKGSRGIDAAEFICGEIMTAEKPKALRDLSAVRNIPGFSHRHGQSLPVEGGRWSLCDQRAAFSATQKKEAMLRP